MMKSRTWKRVLAAVCAGVAAVSMAACGGGTNNTAKGEVIINSVMNSTSQASLNYNPFFFYSFERCGRCSVRAIVLYEQP